MEVKNTTIKEHKLTLRQVIESNPRYLGYVLDAMELLVFHNEWLKKIAAKYSHDLRSPVTNIHMLLQLFDRAEDEADKAVYIKKMTGSVERLQEGFDELSNARKNSLRRDRIISSIHLQNSVNQVSALLTKNVQLTTDFEAASAGLANAYCLESALYLLASPFEGNGDEKYTIQLSTRKTWDGLILQLNYPEFINLTGLDFDIPVDTINKEAELIHWNYYFALLFLGSMGATISIEETERSHTQVFITLTNTIAND